MAIDLIFLVIFQPDRFTKVWLALQTLIFILQWISLVWYSQRLFDLNRPKTLIEKSILTIACGIQFANFPLQWIALLSNAPWMLLVSDIRTGLVYFLLFGFWVVFISEHLLERPNRNKMSNYKIEMCLIIICTCSMFIYDCVERGIQIAFPFWSIHDSIHGQRLATAMPIVGAVTGSLYSIYLLYLVLKVSINLVRRQNQFIGRLNREGLVFRFQLVISLTVISAVFSLVVFNFSQFSDEPSKVYGYNFQVNSAMHTGLYVLWNLYVLSLLILYAPSHKRHVDSSSHSEATQLIQSSSIASIESRTDSILLPSTLNHTSTADALAPLTQNKFATD